MKKVLIGVAVLLVLAGAAFGVLSLGRGSEAQGKDGPAPTLPAVKAPGIVVAEAAVIPAQSALLSLEIGGTLAQVGVSEGQTVTAGQLLASLDATQRRNAVADAEAALRTAEAQLARAQVGPTQEDIAAAEAAVEVARAGVKTAEAGVEVAQSGVKDAEAGVVSAHASLARVQAGPSAEDIAIAERGVEQAKNALWATQAQRDATCGKGGKSECDAAQATVQQSGEAVRIAELQLQKLKRGASRQDIAVAQAELVRAEGQVPAAQARVAQAQEQVSAAQAQVKQAEANLARAKRGPSPEDIAVVQSQVEQARQAVADAKAVLAQAELRAPFAGSVVSLNAKAGEFVSPGQAVVQLADLTRWQVETTDLTELNIVQVKEGAAVSITFDALPGLELTGKVTRIKALGENRRGDITYKVLITPDTLDARLRWNMTAKVTIPS